MPGERRFGYAVVRRWAFLILALANVPVVWLALRRPLVGPGLDWVAYLLCANIIVGPLALQMVRLAREMVVTVNEEHISGRTFFGRVVRLSWGEVRQVARVLLPLRGAAIIVLSRQSTERIVFAESIQGVEELLGLIQKRASGCEMRV